MTQCSTAHPSSSSGQSWSKQVVKLPGIRKKVKKVRFSISQCGSQRQGPYSTPHRVLSISALWLPWTEWLVTVSCLLPPPASFCCSMSDLLISCIPSPTHWPLTTPQRCSLEKNKKLIILTFSLLLCPRNPCVLFPTRSSHRTGSLGDPGTSSWDWGTSPVQLKPEARWLPLPCPRSWGFPSRESAKQKL